MFYIGIFIFFLIFLFGPAIIYQVIESIALSHSALPKKEKFQLIVIRFATVILCYLSFFITDIESTFDTILLSLTIPALIALALVFVATILYMKPSKPKYIQILLYFLSGIILFVIGYNFFAIPMSV